MTQHSRAANFTVSHCPRDSRGSVRAGNRMAGTDDVPGSTHNHVPRIQTLALSREVSFRIVGGATEHRLFSNGLLPLKQASDYM